MRKIILIDDDYAKGWDVIFSMIFKDVYGDLITFECLKDIDDESIDLCYKNNLDALFIQDNQLSHDQTVKPGIYWVEKYAKTHAIVMHTSDGANFAFAAAKLGALMFMRKDNPEAPMTNSEMKKMIVEFHKVIIKHFELTPELIWIVYDKFQI